MPLIVLQIRSLFTIPTQVLVVTIRDTKEQAMAFNLEDVFESAISKFKTDTGLPRPEIRNMQGKSLADVQKILHDVQQDHVKSRTQRNLKRLKPFLDTMEQYGKGIDVLANSSDAMAWIWVSKPHSQASFAENLRVR